MAGRMGGDNVKVQNLRVLKVIADKNLTCDQRMLFLDVKTLT
jgi:ribosomal protein L3